MNKRATAPAAHLLSLGLCSPECLLAREQTCVCRCGGDYHGELAYAPVSLRRLLRREQARNEAAGDAAPAEECPPADGRAMTLREAMDAGIFGDRSLAAVRKAIQRLEEKGRAAEPAVRGANGTPHKWTVEDHHAMARELERR